MRGLVRKTILATAIAGSGIFLAAGAQAHEWRGEHRQYVEAREHWRHVEPLRRFVYERPPVFVAHRLPSWWYRHQRS